MYRPILAPLWENVWGKMGSGSMGKILLWKYGGKSSCEWLGKSGLIFPNKRAHVGEPSKAGVARLVVETCKACALKVP